MTVSGQSSPLCLFQTKVEDALSLVPAMGAEEKLKAVQFWNIISEKLQEIVNNSAADINALAMKLNETKKLPMQSDNNAVPQENIYSNEYVGEVSGFVVCADSDSHCVPQSITNHNGHYIPQNGTAFTTVCYPEISSDHGIAHTVPVTSSENEPITYIKSLSSNKCLSSIEPESNGDLMNFTLPTNETNLDAELLDSSRNPDSPMAVAVKSKVRPTRKRTQRKQNKCIKKHSPSMCHVDSAVSETVDGLGDFCSLRAVNVIDQTVDESVEDSTVDASLESACSSMSDSFDLQKSEGFTTIDDKMLKADQTNADSEVKNDGYVCDCCKQEFADCLSLETHRWTHKKPFVCTECDAQFSSKGNLMVHFRRHTGEKPYHCLTCTARFSTKGNLRRHMKVHSGDKPHECLQCGAHFTEKKSLKVHMRRHTGEKPYGCKICGKCFSQSGILQAHMAVHMNERSHLCEYCGKAFRQKSQLRVHKMRHQGVRNYSCQTCPARFLTKGDLERHVRVHTGERPFACDLCKKTFTRQQSLKEHLNRHYGLKPFRCKHCSKSFAEMSACYKHAKQHEREAKTEDSSNASHEDSYNQDGDSSSTIRISSTESLSQISVRNSNSKVDVIPGQKLTVIFENPGQDMEVHSEFTVDNESLVGSSIPGGNKDAKL